MTRWPSGPQYVNAGKAKQSQIDTVKTAYNNYYDAIQVLKAVCEKLAANQPGATPADLALANTAVTNAGNALMDAVGNIINAVVKHNS